MSITVVVCTFNRCGMLVDTLKSIAESSIPSSVEWEILVVDNNSTDETKAAVDRISREYPGRFRYLLEKSQGVSHARNAGIHASRGDILAFTDDDVTVEASWLWNLTSPLHAGDWAGAAGRIAPVWSCARPPWLPVGERSVMAAFVAFDLGPIAGPLLEPPFGANMAFRKSVFAKYGGFRTDLGRTAERLLGSEDSEFGRRLLVNGERLRYEPSAVVHHPVPESRLSKKYHLAWWYGKARSDIRASGIPEETRWLFGGIPLFLLRRFARWALQWMTSVEPSRRFYAKLVVWRTAGEIVECYRYSRSANKRLGDSMGVRSH